MGRFTIITEDATTEVPATVTGDEVRLGPAAVAEATGWTIKPEGLCRGEVCVPRALWVDALAGDEIELGALAAMTGQVVAVDPGEAVAVLVPGADERSSAMASLRAQPFTVDTIDGQPVSLDDFSGRKKLLMTFSSWCGCRYDLPAWEAIHRELEPHGLSILAVAVDEDPEAVRPWTEEADATFPVLLDRDHVITERYSIVNVPTVVWIDEENNLVRPNDVAFGDDQFIEFHGVDSKPHHEALRRWVLDDVAPLSGDEIRAGQVPPSQAHQQARAEYRLALHLLRADNRQAADPHFDRAAELAPLDFTIRRAVMPLRGEDPFFGETFLELYEEWEAAGRPYYVPDATD